MNPDNIPPTVRSIPPSEDSVAKKLDRVIENQKLLFEQVLVLQSEIRKLRGNTQ